MATTFSIADWLAGWLAAKLTASAAGAGAGSSSYAMQLAKQIGRQDKLIQMILLLFVLPAKQTTNFQSELMNTSCQLISRTT